MLELSTIVSFVAITSFRRKARAVQESRISARQYVQAWYELHVPFSRRNTVTYAPNQLESLLRWTSSLIMEMRCYGTMYLVVFALW